MTRAAQRLGAPATAPLGQPARPLRENARFRSRVAACVLCIDLVRPLQCAQAPLHGSCHQRTPWTSSRDVGGVARSPPLPGDHACSPPQTAPKLKMEG